MKNEVKYLYLKFGDFKGGDFEGSPEAFEISEQLESISDAEERKIKTCQMIDLFNGEIFEWWRNITLNKEQAKAYIMNYETNRKPTS